MKKKYISPVVEIVASQLNQEVLAGHSGEWGDAKDMTFSDGEEEVGNNDLQIKDLWDD